MLQIVEPSPSLLNPQMIRGDLMRRRTYPDNAEPDTVAICEAYRIRYSWGRVLKALSFGLAVSVDDLVEMCGIHRAILHSEIKSIIKRTGLSIQCEHTRGYRLAFVKIVDSGENAILREVITQSWSYVPTNG